MIEGKKNSATIRPRLRVLVNNEIALGPGKIDLLEAIQSSGSISQAAKEIHLSYRRAWDMVSTMNHCFKSPLVESSTGGKGGGGARLTPLGKSVTQLYRDMECSTLKATQKEWTTLKRSLKLSSKD